MNFNEASKTILLSGIKYVAIGVAILIGWIALSNVLDFIVP